MAEINDVSLAMLEENITTMASLTSTISAKLDAISRNNQSAIYNLEPLLNKIEKSQITEDNLKVIYGQIGHMEEYNDRTFEVLKTMEQNKGMNNIKEVQMYTNSLNHLDEIQSDMKQNNVTVFKGLKDALNKGYDTGEVELKRALKNKLQSIGDEQRNIVNGYDNNILKVLEQELKYIYDYLTKNRGMNLIDVVINERRDNALRNCENYKPIMPDIGRDQNDIYTGKNGKPFEAFTNKIQEFMIQETNFLNVLLKGTQNSVPQLSGKILDMYINEFLNGLNYIIGQISRRKTSYCTMYFELALSTNRMAEWFNKHRIPLPDSLVSMIEITTNESKSVFVDFFNYASNLFQTSPKNSNPSLSSEFNMVINRLKNFELLYIEELHFIQLFKFQEWLPKGFPKTFVVINSDQTDDPRLMLSTFYSDVIIWTFHLLDDKYKHDDSQRVGVMLLSNFDSAKSMVENGKLRKVLGQNGVDRISKLQKKALDKATSSWSTLCADIMKASTTTGSGNVNMSKNHLKSFIEKFNVTLDHLCANFKTDTSILLFKGMLISEIETTLLPVYSLFLAKVPPSTKNLLTLAEVKAKITELKR